MTIAEAYLGSSQVFRRLKNGPHGQLIERYAARLVEDGLARHGTWRCLNMVGGLLSWMASHRIERLCHVRAFYLSTPLRTQGPL